MVPTKMAVPPWTGKRVQAVGMGASHVGRFEEIVVVGLLREFERHVPEHASRTSS